MTFINVPDLSVQAFRDLFSNRGGFQSVNRYLVKIYGSVIEGGRSFYPDSITLPQIDMSDISDQYFLTPRAIPLTVDQGNILLTFITMQDWKERTFFEEWMNYAAYGASGNRLGWDFCSVLPYNIASDFNMDISFYEVNNPTTISRMYHYYEVYPKSISNTTFESGASGYVTFQVLLNARIRSFTTGFAH